MDREAALAGDWLVTRRAGLIEAEVDGELVALHVDNGTCYGFNGTATRIWAMIEEPRTPERASRCADRANMMSSPKSARRQLFDLLKDLEGDGLLELRPVAD